MLASQKLTTLPALCPAEFEEIKILLGFGTKFCALIDQWRCANTLNAISRNVVMSCGAVYVVLLAR